MPAESYRCIKQQVRAAALAEIESMIETGADPMLEGWFGPEARDASLAVLEPSRTARGGTRDGEAAGVPRRE